jgi:hypothetical protein
MIIETLGNYTVLSSFFVLENDMLGITDDAGRIIICEI